MADPNTDALHAAAVRDAVAHLRRVVDAAVAAGLRVEVQVRDKHTIGVRHPKPILDVTVDRPL